MSKTVPAPLETHVKQITTSLATGWKFVRKDGQITRVNTAGLDVTADFLFPSPFDEGEQTYTAAEGVNRTSLESDAEMNVDNMEIAGVFDGVEFDEQELRRGLWNGAEVFIFSYNHQEPGDGAIRMFRAKLGVARVSDKGFFHMEMRSFIEVFRRKLGEHYSKDCRADLGDARCRIPINPDTISRSLVLSVGEFYKVRTDPAPDDFACRALILPFDGADTDTFTTDFSRAARTATFVGNAQIDTAFSQFGGSSLLLDGAGDYVTFPSSIDFGPQAGDSNMFSFHCFIRPDVAGSGTIRTIASHYTASGSQRSWFWTINTDQTMTFAYSLDGVAVVSIVTVATITHDVLQHVAVWRTNDGTIRIAIGGVIDATTGSEPGAFFAANTDFRIGARNSTGIGDFFEGHIDEYEHVNGLDLFGTSNFTPPSSGLNTTDPGEPSPILQEMFEEKIYMVTVAGTTHSICQPVYDEGVGNSTEDGTAELIAEDAWMRSAEVIAVDSSNVRRTFTVTELTPNSGGGTDGRNQFPDDSMNGGAVFFEGGADIGRGMEIRDFVADDGITIEQDIELFRDMPFDIAVGDKLRLFRGCDKTHAVCVDIFANALNAVAEWRVPGPDAFGKFPDAR